MTSRSCRLCNKITIHSARNGLCYDCEKKANYATAHAKKTNDPLLNNCPNCGESLTKKSWEGLISPSIMSGGKTGYQKVTVICTCKAELTGERDPVDTTNDRRVWKWTVVKKPPHGTLTRTKGDWKFN